LIVLSLGFAACAMAIAWPHGRPATAHHHHHGAF